MSKIEIEDFKIYKALTRYLKKPEDRHAMANAFIRGLYRKVKENR